MSNRPVKTFRLGYVKAAVWKNDKMYNVTFVRSYRDNNGDWQDGDSFGAGDLLNLAKLAERAEAYIAEQADE